MDIIQSLALGIVQGLTEFLPISSSGHLIILPKIFSWPDQGITFDIFLHLGTLLAVLLFFRKEWVRIIQAMVFWNNKSYQKDRKLILILVIGILPAVILGIFLGDIIGNQLRLPMVIGINLIFWGIVLGIADIYTNRRKEKIADEENISKRKALIVGLFQAIALMPGVSRSGISIAGGLFAGIDRKTAVRFSFLLSAPLIFGAGLFNCIQVINDQSLVIAWPQLALGLLSAFLSGLLAIKFLTFLATRKNFLPFVIYRILLGALILLFLV